MVILVSVCVRFKRTTGRPHERNNIVCRFLSLLACLPVRYLFVCFLFIYLFFITIFFLPLMAFFRHNILYLWGTNLKPIHMTVALGPFCRPDNLNLSSVVSLSVNPVGKLTREFKLCCHRGTALMPPTTSLLSISLYVFHPRRNTKANHVLNVTMHPFATAHTFCASRDGPRNSL